MKHVAACVRVSVCACACISSSQLFWLKLVCGVAIHQGPVFNTIQMVASTIQLFMHWLRNVERCLKAGHRAFLRARVIPQLRLLNKECFEFWTKDVDVGIGQLVAKCNAEANFVLFMREIPAFLNKEIGLEAEDVAVVRLMLQFKRSVIPEDNAEAKFDAAYATVTYNTKGAVTQVTTGMVDHLHRLFRRDLQIVKGAMQSITYAPSRHKKLLSCTFLKLHKIQPNNHRRLQLMWHRASSVPRVQNRQRQRSRSNSLPLDLLPGM